jgi:uncharacterized SAM-binding protein YcdF (DUF218 family)
MKDGVPGGDDRKAAAARLVFDYLRVSDDEPASADLIVGFGHWDPRIPARCCALYERGLAPRIVFAGGRGAGTADIAGSEAEFFREEARRRAPGIPDTAFVLETTSTNTGENVRNALAALASAQPPIRLHAGLGRVVLVATPYRQRRVWLTCRKLLPAVALFNLPPRATYDEDAVLFEAKGERLASWLPGEVERLTRYADLGFIERTAVPTEILEACRMIECR